MHDKAIKLSLEGSVSLTTVKAALLEQNYKYYTLVRNVLPGRLRNPGHGMSINPTAKPDQITGLRAASADVYILLEWLMREELYGLGRQAIAPQGFWMSP